MKNRFHVEITNLLNGEREEYDFAYIQSEYHNEISEKYWLLRFYDEEGCITVITSCNRRFKCVYTLAEDSI